MTRSTPLPPVTLDAFRNGMSLLPGAVNIITTDGPGGRAGFTASAVCSITDTPPSLLVCINRTRSAAAPFRTNTALCVNTIGPDHVELAMLFGGKTPMEDRFAAAEWQRGTSGAPRLIGATVTFDCSITARHTVGSHDVLICGIHDVSTGPSSEVAVYQARKFHSIGPADTHNF